MCKYLLTLLLLISILPCIDHKKINTRAKAMKDSLRLNDIETFKEELIPSQLSNTDFYLSIPED